MCHYQIAFVSICEYGPIDIFNQLRYEYFVSRVPSSLRQYIFIEKP